jgi:superoxide dismutase, Cu-Zn family
MKSLILIAAIAIGSTGCASMGGAGGRAPDAKAAAMLEPTSGNTARGSVTFVQVGDRVRVSAQLTGLKPNAEHGFHVHEKGDCSSADGMSAGGHFNPAAKPHGDYHSGERHAGDMPNVKADAYGNASASFDTTGITIGSGAADIVGKGLIVHRDPDDYKSQPAGNAGPRIACAVIRKA